MFRKTQNIETLEEAPVRAATIFPKGIAKFPRKRKAPSAETTKSGQFILMAKRMMTVSPRHM